MIVPASIARALIARTLLPGTPDGQLGEITLAPHQLAAAARLHGILAQHGGALLADAVGLGKTYVALAVARRYERVLVVAPAALRDVWSAALARAGMNVPVVSYERLSRGSAVETTSDLVILDEAHHARSPGTRRYAALASVARRAHVLLLTATPLANDLDEVRALLALFIGAASQRLDATALRHLVVRRSGQDAAGIVLPRLAAPQWVSIPDDGETLAAIERLPPGVAAADGGEGGALILYSLVRQWASSRAALRAALRRRLARAAALEAALAAGRLPTRSELAAWHTADGAVQLAFPELVASRHEGPVEGLAAAVQAHAAGVASLLAALRAPPDPDAQRAARLLEIAAAHPGEKVLAFSEFAATVEGLWEDLRRHPGVARLTGAGGEIASGPLTRQEILRRFAPDGQRARAPRHTEAIRLLVTTDLLAEGVDVRDATVVVHLDLPWSPARMEQRVGRARRLGSTAGAISVYAFRPPAPAEALLRVEQRLRRKLDAAAGAIGRVGAVLPIAPGTPGDPEAGPSWVERHSRVIDRIGRWRARDGGDGTPDAMHGALPLVAAVETAEAGWLALACPAGRAELIACIGGAVTSDPMGLERAIVLADGGLDIPVPASAVAAALASAERWSAERAGEAVAGTAANEPDELRRRVIARANRVFSSAPRERRASVAPLVMAVRRLAGRRLPAGTERVLASVTTAGLADDAWLHAVADLDTASGEREPAAEPHVLALILFIPPSGDRARPS